MAQQRDRNWNFEDEKDLLYAYMGAGFSTSEEDNAKIIEAKARYEVPHVARMLNISPSDTGSDIGAAAAMLPVKIAMQGNLDPLAVVAGGAAMRDEAAHVLNAMRGQPFIFNLGHGIVPQTPPEHVASLLELVRGS